ncbi:hypothetical protein BDK51DRAFT_48822 [Blyttiomyces helicus]|uniref:Uncharacterized protein n=1 Tax=Blyttiomyces helicus TaxID=388810 RepID=A0A4P9VY13_9FUNG|nr:hypothetical protein BDK51DRAFT_48822 [Blyttiomyces helicus]|eukprot:RKO84639.1 hypothetical protein BDK51DRAFT_48822 [Blyttiomyces helicus]
MLVLFQEAPPASSSSLLTRMASGNSSAAKVFAEVAEAITSSLAAASTMCSFANVPSPPQVANPKSHQPELRGPEH